MVFNVDSWREKLEGNRNLQAFGDHLSGKSEKTQYTYLYNLSKICEFFSWDCSEFDPRKFTQEHYDELFRQKSKVMKHASVNLYTSIVKVLNNLYSLEIKTRNLKEIDKFTDYITFEELQEIISNADKEAAAVTTFIFCTGLRPVSVLSLKKNQLMLNTKHPYLKNVLLKGGRHQDIIIMYPDLVKP